MRNKQSFLRNKQSFFSNKILIFVSAILVLFVGATPAFAHVTVKPAEVGVGARTNFVVSVPTEEDTPTIQVRLIIPEGVQSIRPNVKPGWRIELKKSGEGENVKVTEIIWSGGSIPAEQRDEFIFSAQAPSETTTIAWKAYQTYANGDIVAWDNSPEVVKEHTDNNPPKSGEDHHNAPKPYSETKVINDLASPSTDTNIAAQNSTQSNLPLILSILALAGTSYCVWTTKRVA